MSKTLAFALVDSAAIFADQIVAFAFNNAADFALLQSGIHCVFSWQHSSKLKSDLRYSPSDAFETFPLPGAYGPFLVDLGKSYHKLRFEIMRAQSIGLTRFYRRFHDPGVADKGIQELRSMHISIDDAVVRAYGWDDLDLGHGFHEVPYLPENDRVRFTISETARVEVLRRLAELNRRRYEEEVARGLHGGVADGRRTTKGRRGKGKKR